MSKPTNAPFSSPRNINLRGSGVGRGSMLLFERTNASSPIGSDFNGLYVNDSNQLVFSAQGSTTTISGGGGSGGATPSWENIFAEDATFTISEDTTFTIAGNRSTATDVVTLTNIAGGSGDVVKIQNAGSGTDISGTDDTWTVSKAGAATFVGVTPGGDITSTGTAIDWDLVDNNASALSFDTSGQAGLLEIVTTNAAESVKTAATILQVTDGQLVATSSSNTAANVLIQNDTITTFGNGTTEDQGVVVVSSDTLTTGDLVRLQLDESALVGGAFLKALETDGGTAVFTIGENGLTTIGGNASGTDAFIITAGDILVTSGHIDMTEGDLTLADGAVSITDADNAASLSVTNNTVTTANQIVSVASTSITTGAVMTLNANTVTHDGEILELISAGDATSTPTGMSITIADVTTGAAKGINVVMAGATTTAVGVSVTMNALTTGTGQLITSSGTMVTTGNLLTLTANSATTAAGLFRVNGNALTSGIAAVITSSATAITGAGRLLRVDHTGVTSTSGILSEFASAANDETTIVRVTASAALAAGTALDLVGASVTTGTLLNIGGLDALTTGAGINLESDSSDTSSRVLLQITNDNTAAVGTICLSLKNDSTAGAAMSITGTGVLGIDMSALGVADTVFKVTGTTDATMKAPQTVAADEFIKIDIGGAAHYIPCYLVA